MESLSVPLPSSRDLIPRIRWICHNGLLTDSHRFLISWSLYIKCLILRFINPLQSWGCSAMAPKLSANVVYLFFLTWSIAQTSQTIVNAPIYTPRVARSALFVVLASNSRDSYTSGLWKSLYWLIVIHNFVQCTNLISPRSAHGAVGLPRRWSCLAITPSPMRWFNDRLRLRRSELRNGTHCGAAAARRIHLTPTNSQSTFLLYSMFCKWIR